MQCLAGKTALITGGNSGIGLATAQVFLEAGAHVIITGRSPATLAEAEATLGALPVVQSGLCRLRVLASEAADLTAIAALMEQIRTEFGQLDILFANAAIAQPAPFELVSEAAFDSTVDVNLKGVFFVIQKALPLMPAGASIMVTTSITNQMGSPNFSVYAACKAALRSLVQSLGLELISRGIRINAISPGPISTPMFGRFGLPSEAEQAIRAEIQRKSPIQRFGDPLEVATVARFLASSDASYIVGQEIVVDGGMSLL